MSIMNTRPGLSLTQSKVQYWQLIGIPRPISSYCFYKDICPSPNLYPNLLQMTILHLYGVVEEEEEEEEEDKERQEEEGRNDTFRQADS